MAFARTNDEKLKSLRAELREIMHSTDYQSMIDQVQSLGHRLRSVAPGVIRVKAVRVQEKTIFNFFCDFFNNIWKNIKSSFRKMWHVWASILIIVITIFVNIHFGQAKGSDWDADHKLWCFGAGLVAVSFLIGICSAVEAKTWNYILTAANVLLVIATGILMHYEKCLIYA